MARRRAPGSALAPSGAPSRTMKSVAILRDAAAWPLLSSKPVSCNAISKADHRREAWSPGQPAEVDDALPRRPLDVVDKGRHRLEANSSFRLLGIAFAVKGTPAAGLIEGKIVRLAEEEGKLDVFAIAHGLDRRVECDAGVAAAATVRAGRDTTDAADVKFASVPGYVAEVNADVTRKAVRGRFDHHTQVGMGPPYVAPGELLHHFGRPDRFAQRFCHRPRCVAVQNFDLDGHSIFSLAQPFVIRLRENLGQPHPPFPKFKCLRPMEPSIRVPVKPRLPSFSDITP